VSIWYIAIGGQQQGPLALDELLLTVREKGAGNVHVYREGFTDWKLASEVADITRRLKLLPPLPTAEPAPSVQPAAPPDTVPSSAARTSLPTADASGQIARGKIERESVPIAQGGNFIVRHWRGELPLWMSYWIVALLGSFFVQGVRIGLLGTVSGEPRALPPALIVAMTFLVLASVWQMVGLWRSAVNYKRMRRAAGQAAFWGGVVQALMLAWIVIWLGRAVLYIKELL
jgi:hypothetical protein